MAWTLEHDARLRALWQTDLTQTEIARQLGFSAAYVSGQAARLGLQPRRTSTAERDYLAAEASRRGLSPRALRERLLRTITHDRIIGAVLDDLPVNKDQNADASLVGARPR